MQCSTHYPANLHSIQQEEEILTLDHRPLDFNFSRKTCLVSYHSVVSFTGHFEENVKAVTYLQMQKLKGMNIGSSFRQLTGASLLQW